MPQSFSGVRKDALSCFPVTWAGTLVMNRSIVAAKRGCQFCQTAANDIEGNYNACGQVRLSVLPEDCEQHGREVEGEVKGGELRG